MPTFIERKAISRTRGIGTGAPANLPAHDALDEEWGRIVSSLLGAGFPVLDDK